MEDKPTNKSQTQMPPETDLSSGEQPEPADNTPPEPEPSPPPRGRFKALSGFHNKYFVIFLLLIVVAILAIIVSVRVSQNDKDKNKAASLTDQQLAELKGSTTVVGDSQQLLDIQSSSVFEGPVLMRNNLEVAGALKVGGTLSLPSITVGGNTTLGKVDVNGNLSVAGTATLQNGLTVSGPVSFANSVSTGSLKVSSLQLTGDLQVSRHVTVGGGIPSKSNGSALGGGGTVSVSGGDTAGTITIHTGGGAPAGCFGTFNFARPFNSTPHVVVSPGSSAGAALRYYTIRSSTSFSLCTTTAPVAGTTYTFDYIAID